jgi:hypothetical protein
VEHILKSAHCFGRLNSLSDPETSLNVFVEHGLDQNDVLLICLSSGNSVIHHDDAHFAQSKIVKVLLSCSLLKYQDVDCSRVP